MKLTVIKWRHIPPQVKIKTSPRPVEKIQPATRYMQAADSAAMAAGAVEADAYLTDWNNELIEIPDGDLKEPVATKAAELESEFSDEILTSYINNGGYKPLDFFRYIFHEEILKLL